MKQLVRWITAWVLVLPAAMAKEQDPSTWFNETTSARSTPHVAWGKPLDGGPIRTLFIAPRFTMRDAVELGQRLDLKLDTAPVWDAHHLGPDPDAPELAVPGASAEETLDKLRRRLDRKYDLIVLGNVALSILPEDVLSAIETHVAGGGGLLLAHIRDEGDPGPAAFLARVMATAPKPEPPRFFEGIGESMTPEWVDGIDFVTAATFEAGRVVRLAYPGEPPRTHCVLPTLGYPLLARPEFLDTYFSLVARAARWAAGRDPSVQIERIEFMGPAGPAEDEIPPGLPREYINTMRNVSTGLPYQPYRLVLNGPADRALRVVAQVREPNRALRVVFPYDRDLAKGETTYPIWLVVGPGRYLVDVWLFDGNAVVDWYTEVVTVEGGPEFTDLTFSKASLMANDTLEVSLAVRPRLHLLGPTTVYARATDTLGRRVAEAHQPAPVEGGPVRLTLNFADLMTGLVKIDVFVLDGTVPPFTHWDRQHAAHAVAHLPVRRIAPSEALLVAAPGLPVSEYNVHAYLRTFGQLGVDLVTVPATSSARLFAGQANLYPVPELTRPTQGATADGIVSQDNLADPGRRAQEAEQLRGTAALFWAGGSGLYALGGRGDLSLDPDYEAPSPSCLAGFQAWLRPRYGTLSVLNEAWGTGFSAWADVRPPTPEQAMASGDFAGQVEFRRYRDAVFSDTIQFARDAVLDVDGRGRLAIFPTDPADAEGVSPHVARGAVGSTFRLDAAGTARWFPWHAVLHGMAQAWWDGPIGTAERAAPHVSLTPDGRPTPAFAALLREAAALKAGGLDALLLQAHRKKARIAIGASRSSVLLNRVDPSFGCDSPQAEAGFARLFGDLGHPYDFVALEDPDGGTFDGYDVLVLPMARALSDASVAAVRAFHETGGLVIADVAPGSCDERGIRRAEPPLAGIFGVRHVTPVRAGAAADTPVWLVNEAGPGLAVLIGHPLSAGDEPSEAWRTLRASMAAILGRAGVEPLIRLENRKTGSANMEYFMSQYGSAEIVALLRGPGGRGDKKLKGTLRFGRDAHVYDLRLGERVRGPRKVAVALAPGEVALYASLPYEVTALRIDAPEDAVAGRRLPFRLAVKTLGRLPGEHMVHIDVAPVSRGALAHYARNIVCPSGAGRGFIPLALNEAPGAYHLTARDVLTGATARVTVRITAELR